MKKSYYILLTITATAAVLYLLGNWVGRSFGLNRQQVIRNIHEAYGRATDAFEAGQTKDLLPFSVMNWMKWFEADQVSLGYGIFTR